jgi:osmotically inducible protein OsmC
MIPFFGVYGLHRYFTKEIVPKADADKAAASSSSVHTTTRCSSAVWNGNLVDGKGRVTMESSGIGTFDVNWPARVDPTKGVTSPEELLGSAHASCYCMALSHGLTSKGTPPSQLNCKAEVDFTLGVGITNIRLFVSGVVPGLNAAGFKFAAEEAKSNCPMSMALKAIPITLIIIDGGYVSSGSV